MSSASIGDRNRVIEVPICTRGALTGRGFLANRLARLRRLAQREDVIGDDRERELWFTAILRVEFGFQRTLNAHGVAIGEAAKRFGVHRNTITKMLSFSVPPGCRRRERPTSKKLGAMSRLMLKSAKRASLIENLRSLRGLGKMRVR